MARTTKTPRTNGSAVKKQSATSEITPTISTSPALTSVPAIGDDVQGEIRQRAYELYEQRGCAPGHENDDWLVAEREVLSRHDQRQNVA
jgi:hypothetical protein